MNYWNCSKFANWIRGTTKPKVASADEWTRWEVDAKTKHPIRYWIAEELLDSIQNLITAPSKSFNNVRYYINNRWVTRSHQLTAHPRDIKPGQWCDLSDRIIFCLFNELVNFVEIEQAWHHVAWDESARKQFRLPWYHRWVRVRHWRSPEAGIAHLNWAMNLTNKDWLPEDQQHTAEPNNQAVVAKEIYELYMWWKHVRPNRPDPYDESGFSAYCDAKEKYVGSSTMALFSNKTTPELEEQGKQTLSRLHDIEQSYSDEDEEMLIRLIKIRKNLWT